MSVMPYLPGFGDYEFTPNLGHPLDPRNDSMDDEYEDDEDDSQASAPSADSQG
jgi:hypothetical protein